MELKESLYNWIVKISSNEFGPACPYAMGAWLKKEVLLADDHHNVLDLVPLKEGISICVVPMLGISYDDLSNLCEEYSKKFEDYLFLDSHPEETLTLRGNKTVWEYPAILIQRKKDIIEARNDLIKKGFYNNWDKDLLDSLEINLNK